tara:strand:- start:2 stop:268 length:267 start_codon:yes stop_codon:yes gene_type:complete
MRKKRKSVKLRKEHKSPSGGLTKKGREKINRETGSNLKAPVTKTKNLTKSEKARKKSFCARMAGVKGPLRDKKGRKTRKALALEKWNC